MKLFKIKPAKNDYVDSMLPTNRKEVFVDVFKLHWKTLMLLGLVILLSGSPFIFVEIYKFMALINISNENEFLMNSVLINNIANLVKLPFFILFGLAISGVIRLIRQFCWIENVTLSYDFFLGVKQNVRQVFLLMIILGGFWYLSNYSLNISYISENHMKYVLALPIGLFIFLIMPIAGYMLVAISTYSNSFIQNIKISFIVYAYNPFKAILCTSLCSLFFVFKVIPNIYIKIIFESIGYLLLPFLLLAFFLYANKQFDKIINEKYYPYLVNKGLYIK